MLRQVLLQVLSSSIFIIKNMILTKNIFQKYVKCLKSQSLNALKNYKNIKNYLLINYNIDFIKSISFVCVSIIFLERLFIFLLSVLSIILLELVNADE